MGTAKTPADDYEQQLYEQFWQEYDGRLSRAALMVRALVLRISIHLRTVHPCERLL